MFSTFRKLCLTICSILPTTADIMEWCLQSIEREWETYLEEVAFSMKWNQVMDEHFYWLFFCKWETKKFARQQVAKKVWVQNYFVVSNHLVTNIIEGCFLHGSLPWWSKKALLLHFVHQVRNRISYQQTLSIEETNVNLILLDKVCNRVACFSLTVYVCFFLLALEMQSKIFHFLAGTKKYLNRLIIVIAEPPDHHILLQHESE